MGQVQIPGAISRLFATMEHAAINGTSTYTVREDIFIIFFTKLVKWYL
jgi:hypothetical protein